MEERPIPPSRAIRLLNVGTTIAMFVLTLVTGVALPLAIYTATGSGTLAVDATLDEVFIVEFEDGQRVSINDDGVSLYENFPIGEETATIRDLPPPEIRLEVQRSDIDSRVIALGSVAAYLAAAWVALLSLKRVIGSAAAGRPFDDRSPRRLRLIAWSLLAVIGVDFLRASLLNTTLEADIAVRHAVDATSAWILITAAVGFFALAWIFSEAGRLRRFEEATI